MYALPERPRALAVDDPGRMPRFRHSARYSGTKSPTSAGLNTCKSSVPSMGHSWGVGLVVLSDIATGSIIINVFQDYYPLALPTNS